MTATRSRLGALGLAGGLVLALAGGAAHAEPLAGPDPGSGPAAGGTVVTVPTPRGVSLVAVDAGGFHSLALGSDGGTYGWGSNFRGQLGNDTLPYDATHLPVPVLLPDGVAFEQISAGYYHSLGLTADGTPFSWGGNANGELGNGQNADVKLPTALPLPGGKPLLALEAGYEYSVAVDAAGDVFAWGKNHMGQLGDGSQVGSNTPVHVGLPDDAEITQVSPGAAHTLALASDGQAYAWGDNEFGQLGDDSAVQSNAPVPVALPDGVKFIAVGAGSNHSAALGDDGKAYSWGHNFRGQLGHGDQSTNVARPTAIEGVDGVEFVELDVRADHTLARTSTGETYAWGGNRDGQLGVGTNAVQLRPALVAAPAGVSFSQLGTDMSHTVAVGSDGNAYAWGWNADGQLGLGNYADQNAPVPVRTEVAVKEIAFGGVAGTTPPAASATGWQTTTPEHAPGVVDVTVAWQQLGVTHTETYAGGFEFLAPATLPAVTDPKSVTVQDGETAKFTVTASGTPAPDVAWQQSSDGGKTWAAVGPGATVTSSGETSTLAIAAALADSGLQFRAVATNSAGSVESAAATLTVTAEPAIVPPTTTPPTPAAPLAQSGVGAVWPAVAGITLLLAAGAAALVAGRSRAAR